MANIFLVSHILLLFHSPKGSAKYEKLGKYWPYCTRDRAITNAYFLAKMQAETSNFAKNDFSLADDVKDFSPNFE